MPTVNGKILVVDDDLAGLMREYGHVGSLHGSTADGETVSGATMESTGHGGYRRESAAILEDVPCWIVMIGIEQRARLWAVDLDATVTIYLPITVDGMAVAAEKDHLFVVSAPANIAGKIYRIVTVAPYPFVITGMGRHIEVLGIEAQ